MKKITKILVVLTLLINSNHLVAQCFTPLYNDLTNICPDPEANDLGLWAGWGDSRVVGAGSDSYCGNYITMTSDGTPGGCGWPGTNGVDSALDFGVAWEPNATYHVRVMIKTVGGTIALKTDGTDPSVEYEITTDGEWQLYDHTFTTGANPDDSRFITINSCDLPGDVTPATTVYIDNFELYNITSTLSIDNASLANRARIAQNPVKDRLNISTSLEVSSINIYDALGRVVISKKKSSRSTDLKSIDVSTLSGGYYILQAKIDNKMQVFKFLK